VPLLLTLILFFVGLNPTQAAPDEIDAWVKTFNAERLNGFWPHFDLPADAPPEKLVAALADDLKKSDGTGQFHNYRIVETKKMTNQIHLCAATPSS